MQDDLHMVDQTRDDLLDGWLNHQRVTCSLSIVFGRYYTFLSSGFTNPAWLIGGGCPPKIVEIATQTVLPQFNSWGVYESRFSVELNVCRVEYANMAKLFSLVNATFQLSVIL